LPPVLPPILIGFSLEHKPFAPVLHPGQQLQFDLRANPVVNIPTKPGERGRRHDVVMHALSRLAAADRAAAREKAIQDSGGSWLARKAEIAGFSIDRDRLHIDRYEHIRVPRQDARAVIFSSLTFQGVLTVREPAQFLTSVLVGFGAAKAYGCGLMLIRRAST
jgi:CRISPR system Cascade subunit CasE